MERDKVMDATKYLLISLVVIGHFIEPTKYTDDATCLLYCLIYSFHMPLFVLISGYFYKRRAIKEEIRKCIPLVEICALSHVGFCLIRNGGSISFSELVYFGADASWYLLSLVCWRIMTCVASNFLSVRHLLMVSAFVDLCCFLCLRYGGFMSVGRTVFFYPFFLMGYCFRDKLMAFIRSNKIILSIWGGVALAFVITTFGVLQFQIEFQRNGVPELTRYSDVGVWQIVLFRYAIVVCSLLISGLFLILVDGSPRIQKLSRYGSGTLFIYYIQTFMCAVVFAMEISLVQSLLIAVVTIPVLTYLSRFKSLSGYITNPVSRLMRL